MERVTFYIDGFNFYFGIKRARKSYAEWGKCYWIDIVALCNSFLGDGQQLEKVVYFTAAPLSPSKNSRQSAFLNANKLINGDKFEIVRGKYIDKTYTCPSCNAKISKPEEKKTDVNISVRIISDCVLNKTDKVCLVSADCDLIPPLEFIQNNYPNIGIKIYFPPTNYSTDMKDNLKHHRSKPILLEKNIKRFINSIMPNEVVKGNIKYTIPNKWEAFSNQITT